MESYEDYKKHVVDDIETCLDSMGCQPILFIGSGLSRRYFNAPSWEELLKIMAEKCPLIDKDFAYYKQSYKDPIKIGSVFAELYKEWAWGEGKDQFPEELFTESNNSDVYIKHSISEYLQTLLDVNWIDALDQELKDEINSLKKISPHAIITTNYDYLIEKIFPDFESVIGQKILRANTFSIGELFKIHGSISEPNSLVLTSNDYQEFSKKKKYLSAKLLAFFAEHPLLFIGYSASDPNIQEILSDIDEILTVDNSLIPNIYILERDEAINENDYPQREKTIVIDESRNIRVKSISTSCFKWVFESFINNGTIEPINPKLLRSLLARTYDLVRHDIPRRTVEVDFQTLEHAVSSGTELAKLYGITTVDDPSSFNAQYPFTLTMVGQELGYKSWHNANQFIDRIAKEKGVNIKESDNKYHLKVKVGASSFTHKYSQSAVDLLLKVKDGDTYEIKI